jgi:hypothetical protein
MFFAPFAESLSYAALFAATSTSGAIPDTSSTIRHSVRCCTPGLWRLRSSTRSSLRSFSLWSFASCRAGGLRRDGAPPSLRSLGTTQCRCGPPQPCGASSRHASGRALRRSDAPPLPERTLPDPHLWPESLPRLWALHARRKRTGRERLVSVRRALG